MISYSGDVHQYKDNVNAAINSIKEDLYELISADSSASRLDYITDINESLRQINIYVTGLADTLKEVLEGEEKDV